MGNLIVGIIFLIGGLSGSMVLRGTNSALGLAAFGAVLAVIGVVQLSRTKDGGGQRRRTTTRVTRGTRGAGSAARGSAAARRRAG